MTTKELLQDIQEFLDQLGTAKPLYVKTELKSYQKLLIITWEF